MYHRGNILVHNDQFFAFSNYSTNGVLAYKLTIRADEIELATKAEELQGVEEITFTVIFTGSIFHESLNRFANTGEHDLSIQCFHSTLDRADSDIVCRLCGTHYQYDEYLRRHLVSHTEEEMRKHCPCCTRKFSSAIDFVLHRGAYSRVDTQYEAQTDRECRVKTGNGMTYFQCIQCKKRFRTADDYLNHMALKREINLELDFHLGQLRKRYDRWPIFLCNSCLFPTFSAQGATEHLLVHGLAAAIAAKEARAGIANARPMH